MASDIRPPGHRVHLDIEITWLIFSIRAGQINHAIMDPA
jgi:hypothetical protein